MTTDQMTARERIRKAVYEAMDYASGEHGYVVPGEWDRQEAAATDSILTIVREALLSEAGAGLRHIDNVRARRPGEEDLRIAIRNSLDAAFGEEACMIREREDRRFLADGMLNFSRILGRNLELQKKGIPLDFPRHLSYLGVTLEDTETIINGITVIRMKNPPIPGDCDAVLEFMKIGASVEGAIAALDECVTIWHDTPDDWEAVVRVKCRQISLGR